MPSFQNKKIFGENRLIFLSEIPSISRGDVSTIEGRKEKKVEQKLDEEGKVIKEGREAATWSVDSLVARTNSALEKNRSALAELPQSFNTRFRSEIVSYIKNSPDRFENDEYRGLSNAEFKRLSDDVHSQVKTLVDRYAPTEQEIAAKKKATLNAEQAMKLSKTSYEQMQTHAESLEKTALSKISDDPGPIPDLPTLAQKMTDYQSWNEAMQRESGAIAQQVGEFQRSFSDFAQARNGLQSYKKFVDYFAGGDPDRQDLLARKGAIERRLKTTIEKARAAQGKLDKYGEKMRKASNEQKQEKIKERDGHLRRIEEDRSLSKKEKAAKKAQFERVKSDRDALQERRDDLQRYKDEVVVTQKEQIEDRMEYAETRQDQMQTYGTIMRASVAELDRMLEDPRIPEPHKEALRKTRDQIADKEEVISLAEIGISATLDENYDQWNALSAEEQAVAQQTYNIETHITADLDPAIMGLDGQIGILEGAMLQYTDSKEVVMKHYEEAFKIYDGIDAAVDNSVLQYSLANEKLIGSLESQQKALGKMSLEAPSGVTGFFEATLGAGLSTVGSGITSAGDWMVEQAVALDHDVEMARENGLSPARYWTAKVLTQVVTAPIGVAGGLAEMGGGIVTMVGQPGNTINGLGALIGRNPATGEWFDGTAGDTWLHLGKAVIQWEHFSNGRIGVGIGKIFPDVVLTLTGVGAVAKGGKAAKVAYIAAREAGETTLEAIRIGAVKGGQVMGTEAIASAREAYSTVRAAPGAIRRAPGKALEYARGRFRGKAAKAEEVAAPAAKAETRAAEAAAETKPKAAEAVTRREGPPKREAPEAATRVERGPGSVREREAVAHAKTEKLGPKKAKAAEPSEAGTVVEKPENLAADAMRQHEAKSAAERVNKTAQEDFGRAIEEITSGKSPLTPEIFDEILRTEFHIPDLRRWLSEGGAAIKMDPRLDDISTLLRRIDEAEIIHADLLSVGRVFEDMAPGAKATKLEDTLALVSRGEKVSPGDELGTALERFKTRDPETFEVLRNTDSSMVIESQCLEAIIGGHRIETVGSKGPISIYVGKKHLGKGGLGTVDEALFVRPGDNKFTKGAYKRALDSETGKYFLKIERIAAQEIATWEHPSLIRALDIGEDYIIYETGSDATSLRHAFDSTPADEWFSSFGETIDGMEELWRQGYFHGDFKAENVLTYIEDGQRVTKIIDLSPIDFEKALDTVQEWGRTPGHFFDANEIEAAADILRKTDHMGPDEISVWLGRAQDVKAMGRSLERAMEQYISTSAEALQALGPEQRALIERMQAFIKSSKDAYKAGNPEMMQELREIMSALKEEFRMARENPARPSIGHREFKAESAIHEEQFGATANIGPKKPAAPAEDPFADWGTMI